MPDLLPLFLNVTGRPVALIGGGRVARAKLQQLVAAGAWQARAERGTWRRDAVPMNERKPRLLRALNALYASPASGAGKTDSVALATVSPIPSTDRGPDIPWLHAPEDSWL